MTTPTNHTVTMTNRFGVTISAPVVYVKPLGEGKAEVHMLDSVCLSGKGCPAC